MGLEELVVTMNTLGIRYTVLESGADGAVLVLPEYGRVLGVWPHWRGENALWVNPDFLRLLQIGAKDDGWLNPGGDRIWLGPEEEFFPPDMIPPSVDPGKYDGIPEKGSFIMENEGQVRAWESDLMLGFRIQRRIRPLSEEEISDMWGTRWLRQAGYSEETTLEVSREIPPRVWLWNITQVRKSSEVLARREERPAADSQAGSRRILCIEEREDGRGQLVVKSFQVLADRPPGGLPHDRAPGRRTSSPPGATEISCVSEPADARSRRRILLRTTLCAFSGRTAEIRTAASLIGS
ncbi:MAG: hypothetical protein ABSG17_09965 [Spirochaetia bacterium]|jgi:hypothetical protein